MGNVNISFSFGEPVPSLSIDNNKGNSIPSLTFSEVVPTMMEAKTVIPHNMIATQGAVPTLSLADYKYPTPTPPSPPDNAFIPMGLLLSLTYPGTNVRPPTETAGMPMGGLLLTLTYPKSIIII